jgi:hypothetical protein
LSVISDNKVSASQIYLADLYPQNLWITLWIARGIFRKCVLQLISSLVLLNFSATALPG